ncbi:hypothetical protein HYU23_00670 [Candidatus Woesearchaeota archaeon]|nr:hypothetical protein [Candidatus Woesearchaeota archaeon]
MTLDKLLPNECKIGREDFTPVRGLLDYRRRTARYTDVMWSDVNMPLASSITDRDALLFGWNTIIFSPLVLTLGYALYKYLI